MPFRKYSNQFRKGVCQLTCDCGHSPSKTAEEYEIPLKTLEKWITAYNKNPCCFDKSDDYYIEKHKEFAKPMIIYLQGAVTTKKSHNAKEMY